MIAADRSRAQFDLKLSQKIIMMELNTVSRLRKHIL